MTSLNISNNKIGWFALPEGWKDTEHNGKQLFAKPDSNSYSLTPPPGAKPEGIIAIANAIPTMRALTSLDISGNNISSKDMDPIREICAARVHYISAPEIRIML